MRVCIVKKIKIIYTNIIRVRNTVNRLKNEPSKTQLFDLKMFFTSIQYTNITFVKIKNYILKTQSDMF